MRSLHHLAVLSSIALALLGAGAAAAGCSDMASPFGPASGAIKRAITERDVLEIRDIGDPMAPMYSFPPRLAVSPDGRRIAFSLVRADLATNAYCLAIYVSGLRAGAVPTLVDQGGEFRVAYAALRGYAVKNGSMAATIPVWSPDGRTIAFLRRDHEVTQAWIARADGGGSRAVSRSASDVQAVAWSRDGRRLLIATQPGALAESRAIDRESDRGWLYDRRVFASYSLRPLVAADQPLLISAIDIASDAVMPAEAADKASLPANFGSGDPAPAEARAGDGRRAWARPRDGGLQKPMMLVVRDAAGKETNCSAEWCRSGIYGLWWDPAGRALYVERREGWAGEISAFYRWIPGGRQPRRILATADVVRDCVWAAAGMACTRENATTPRHIVLIDRNTGHSTTIFDPNPGFASIALGAVRRLYAKSNLGLESWADFVLPPDYKPGTRLPLVIVQYKSQGFLRGGVGDEYPIYVLAAHGFAVLSVERPGFAAETRASVRTTVALNAADFQNWVDRRNVLSALLAEIDLAEATGTVDGTRIGITGVSDGSMTARFAMLNSHRFAAAVVSSCCYDPTSVMSVNGPAFADFMQSIGFPPATKADPDFWKDFSFAVSGARTDTPLLMLLSEHEAASAFESIEALREYRKPVEAYIYPDESHIKWQPVHKYSVTERALDWLTFWLQGKEDPDPAKRGQYIRWRAMRSARVRTAETHLGREFMKGSCRPAG